MFTRTPSFDTSAIELLIRCKARSDPHYAFAKKLSNRRWKEAVSMKMAQSFRITSDSDRGANRILIEIPR